MKRFIIGLIAAILSGVGWFLLAPFSWFVPMFLFAVGATLVFAVFARSRTAEKRPDNAAADMALFVLNIPAQPLAEVPRGWALDCFLWSAAYVGSLAAMAIFGRAFV
jgi:hypothetical protein